jgi:aromatic ring-opening dioxygenase catalytic subunit (LigB family)
MSPVCAGYGVPHTPAFPGLLKAQQGPWREVKELYATVGAQMAEDEIDGLVVFSSDHFNTFFLTAWPSLAIGVADQTSGPNDETSALSKRTVPVDRILAERIWRSLVLSGFDLTRSEDFSLDHTFMVPLELLNVAPTTPIVPMFINSFVDPAPLASRAFALGRAVAEAIDHLAPSRRIGVLATGSFSLEVGGPRMQDDQPWGVPDPAWAREVCDLLEAGAPAELVSRATSDRMSEAGNAAAELLDWIAMLGAIGAGELRELRMQPAFGHAYGSWSAQA